MNNDFLTRYHSKIDKSDVENCWIWRGSISRSGYGVIRESGNKYTTKLLYAHRVMVEITYKEIPSGAVVMHSCDNRLCVNPKHLSIGTHSENLADARAKGRMYSLSEDKIKRILELHRLGISNRDIATMLRVSTRTIWEITNGSR